ncbi:protein IQ-DOMAIN 31-like isoform X2 [Lotus japonicus]|uniref:protein IQ-DOMAIN 31-like isoform X2 n=1 Tax=Lotus japonicus TaxID=34305 RepID=UPI0025879485|nr:protein IQ-DOMAIN 31-like isoform X2 [Lotus japonicus]XP_057446273.1 protein IQ-DOMAIN 31-like isoform X2 [Lotus japonicus]
MGKSPGKWIKTVLFGKKSSKSNISKGRELVNKKEAVVASNVSDNGLAFDPTLTNIARNEEDQEVENEESENLARGNQEIDIMESVDQDAPPDPEVIRLEEAAIHAQAAFRGYMARRAYRALKGIIRLQALIRGHLVRRQAVATLCCMHGIVKLQALVRGGRVRQSDVGFAIHEKCNLFKTLDGRLVESVGVSTKISKQSANTFVCKLLSSSTTIMALHLQYVGGDPNSVSSWLERWSASYFWKPLPQLKKIRDSKSHRKQSSISIGEAQISKSKRTNRKLPTANFESVPSHTNPEFEKPKRNFRKISSQLSDPDQENPQSVLEKVKRNLRKIHNPVVENAILSEVEFETAKQHLVKTTVSERGLITSNEKIKKEATFSMSSVPDVEITPTLSDNKEVSDISSSYTTESKPLTETKTKDKCTSGGEVKNELFYVPEINFKDANSPSKNGHLVQVEDLTANKNKKSTRKASKQEHAENGLQNSPKLPSYMAATESAKAKLRAQDSPRFEQDVSERNSPAGRHSIPSSTNHKISSHSPGTRRSVQTDGRGGHRNERTISSSRGGNGMVVQEEWRR